MHLHLECPSNVKNQIMASCTVCACVIVLWVLNQQQALQAGVQMDPECNPKQQEHDWKHDGKQDWKQDWQTGMETGLAMQ
eukprot:8162801-Ditylum_brightwellii.AAC.1